MDNGLMQQLIMASTKKDDSISLPLNESVEKNIKSLKDSFNNSVLGIGNSDHLAQFDDYSFENNTLNWFLWLSLYNESWVFRRTIDKPSQDMVTAGISITSTCDLTKIYNQLNYMRTDLINAIKWSKLFGGSVLVLLFKGISFEDMENPIDYEKIKGCRYIKCYVTDRWFGCNPSYDDVVSNLANEDFGKPKYYDIQFADGTSHRIHHSWILRFENREAPNLIKTGQLQGWGYSEGQHILHELNRDEKLKSSIQSLVDKSLIEVIQMQGMRGVFMGADKGNEEQLKKRLEMVNWARNHNSLTFLDKEDSYTQHTFGGLTGLSDLLDLNMRQIASACEMPNVLYGDLSNGFTTDDGALERYDEKIINDNETYLRKPYTKLLKILFKVYDLKDAKGNTPPVNFSFNSMLKEKRNEAKLTEVQSLLNVCSTLKELGLMDIPNMASTVQEYMSTNAINFKIIQNKEKLEENIEENIDNIDIDTGDISMGSSSLRNRNSRPNRPNTSNAPTNKPNETQSSESTPNEPMEINIE